MAFVLSTASGGRCEDLATSQLETPLQIRKTTDPQPGPGQDGVGFYRPIAPASPEPEGKNLVWSEDDRVIEIRVSLASLPFHDVRVRWRTVEGSAREGVDFRSDQGVLSFPAGHLDEKTIRIEVFDDAESEAEESFQIQFTYPARSLVGWSKEVSEVEITIVDDEDPVVVPYSVAVDAPDYFDQVIEVSVVSGVAHFADPLPAIVGRGDRLQVEGLGAVFIEHCVDDSTCTVVDGRGVSPTDAYGVVAYSASAAFGSLAEAVRGASGPEYLGTASLVAANRIIEFVCYGDTADRDPVVIADWITSEKHFIRIVTANESYGHGKDWRHSGRWTDTAYRLEIDGADCIDVAVGNLTIEGLQLACGGQSPAGISGIRIEEADGVIEIAETLVMMETAADLPPHAGIAVISSQPLNVAIRNSILWGTGDGIAFQSGVFVIGPKVHVWAANNTIVGGGYGIRNVFGTVKAVNNLLAAQKYAAFEGVFELDSIRNLASDATVKGPPANNTGPVIVAGPTSGRDADFHVRCGVLDQPVALLHDFEVKNEDELSPVFDLDPTTLLRSDSVNPARVRLVFDGVRATTGTSVVLSHHETHEWMVAAAQTVGDLETRTGSYRELVPWRMTDHPEIVVDSVSFADPEAFAVIELTVRRVGGDDYVHINEWILESLNPACGQGVDLSAVGRFAFDCDVDSLTRAGPWDIGADQGSE
jgi:hypothetical protein